MSIPLLCQNLGEISKDCLGVPAESCTELIDVLIREQLGFIFAHYKSLKKSLHICSVQDIFLYKIFRIMFSLGVYMIWSNGNFRHIVLTARISQKSFFRSTLNFN
jgi:hypothetical protein